MKRRFWFSLGVLVLFLFFISLVIGDSSRLDLSPNQNYFVNDSSSITIGNSKTEFIFNGSDTGRIFISQLKNLDTGRTFSTGNNSLFIISFRNESFTKEYSLDDFNYNFSYSIKNDDLDPSIMILNFNWSNSFVPSFGNNKKFDISASVSLSENDSVGEFLINVAPVDSYSIYNLTFPIVNVDGFTNPSDEVVVLPWLMGKLIVNPRSDFVNSFPGRSFSLGGITNSQFYTYQFSAYYDKNTSDLFYFGTRDPTGYYKNVAWGFSDKGIVFSVNQFPENNLAKSNGYSSSYPVVVGVMKGDWYDAAKYYRSWAVDNFVQRGRLENATGISSVFHDLDFKITYSMPSSSNENRANYTNAINETVNFKNYIDQCPDPYMPFYECNSNFKFDNVTIELYNWQNNKFAEQEGWPSDYKPIHSAVMELVKQAHSNGDIVIPYTIQVGFDINSSSYNSTIAEYSVVGENGSIMVLNNPYSTTHPRVMLDPNTTFWQNYVSNIMVDHLNFGDDNSSYNGIGFDGAYWDVWSAGGAFLDYSNRGDHPNGGGDWWASGERNLISLVRQRTSSINPKWIMESEHATESYLNYLEFVQWNFPEPTPLPFYNVPIYPTIFHDYIGTSSIIETSPQASLYYPDQTFNRYFQAIYMSYGIFPGFSNGQIQGISTFPMLEGDHELFSFIKQYVRSYSFSKKYLLYGERLKTPHFITQSYTGFVSPNIFFDDYYPSSPKVMPSMWKSSDGSLGLLLVNWWNETQRINFTIDFEDYGLNIGSTYHLYKVGELGNQLLGDFNNDFNYSLDVPSESLYLLSLSSNSICSNLSPEICSNGIDDNCNGQIDEGCSGGPGGGGGSGGGSRSSPSINRASAQCSDGVDNDGDGLIDFPNDLGCFDSLDNVELDSGGLGGNLDNSSKPSAVESNNLNSKSGFEINRVFVASTIVLVIIILTFLLIRHSIIHRRMNKFKEMSYLSNVD